MRRLLEENVWTLTNEEVERLQEKYGYESENHIVDKETYDKLLATTKIVYQYTSQWEDEDGSEIKNVSNQYLSLVYHSDSYTNSKLSFLNKVFGAVEANIQEGGYAAGTIFGFTISMVDYDGELKPELIFYTSEL